MATSDLSLNWFLVSLGVGPSGRQEFELVKGENVVGRKKDASIALPHLDVSREQCIIFSIDGTLALVDSGSRNGTFVNGQRVRARSSVTLFENDTVGFGANTSIPETYVNGKTPFLVYRVTRKVSGKFFERLVEERARLISQEKAPSSKRPADSVSEVPPVKRVKAEPEVPSAPLPDLASREVSSTAPTSRTNNVSVTKSNGMMEFFVLDDSSDESDAAPSKPSCDPKPVPGTETSSNADEASRLHGSFLTKSVDEHSTLQNGSIAQNSAIESSAPSISNSSTLKKSPARHGAQNSTSAKIELLKTAVTGARIKKEPVDVDENVPRYMEITADVVKEENKGHKPPDILTFSLISDDEDDNELISSQIFVQTEDSQTFQASQGMDTTVIDDDILEIFDSDDESFFESHLSQSLSQSFHFAVDDDKAKKKSSTKSHKTEKTKTDSNKKDSSSRSGVRKDGTSTSKISSSDKKKRSSETSLDKKKTKPSEPQSDKRKTNSSEAPADSKNSKPCESSSVKKRSKSSGTLPSSKKDSTVDSKTKQIVDALKSNAKTRKQHKDANDASSSFQKSVVSSAKKYLSLEGSSSKAGDSKQVGKESRRGSSSTAVSRRGSLEMLQSTIVTSVIETKVENIVRKMLENPMNDDVPKKSILIEPQSLNCNKENKQYRSAGPSEVIQFVNGAAVPAKKKGVRVTFKEQMVDVQEFECLGNMKKISSMPAHLLKEHPTKVPPLQWNGILLRGSQQVADICQWNLKWLQEFQRLESDPPLINYQPSPIQNRFKNFDQYYPTMLSLVLHELWNELCKIHLVQTESKRFNIFSGVIEHIEPNVDPRTHFSRCKIVTSCDSVAFLPNFGDLVGVQILAPNKDRTHLYDSFGVVTRQYSRERLRPSRETNFLLNNFAPAGTEKDNVVVCPVEVLFRASKTHSNVTKDCFVHFRVYKNIMNQVKYFIALQKVFSSPLKSVILDPTKSAKGTERQETQLSSKLLQHKHLNDLQKAAVAGVTNSVLNEENSISLIHGPPGTGKSSTITHLILNLLPILRKSHRKGPPPKVLLCAPSNTAIDQLCVKLLDIRKSMPDESKFKLTRVGNVKMMHPQVLEISSTSLARRGLMNTPDTETLETEVTLLQARIQGFRNGLACTRSKPNEQQKYRDAIEKCETRLAFYSKTLANIKSGRAPCNPDENRRLLNHEECTIISGAEIIATTLCSSSSKKISDALTDSTKFSCCIVDEATQATEPEMLIPLHHDIRHLVLVGDPQQLGPTVTSKFAKENNFEWSLYHRLMGEWKEYKGTPLYPLREQYRMQAEIVSFPSTKFYNSELKTPDFLKLPTPFSSYHVVSHPWHENSNEESNEKEARFIVELVQKIRVMEVFSKLTFGIIVPYQTQRSLISNLIQERRDKVLDGVVVNTIDSYQGQEKDVIILSCVRTKRIGFLSDRQRLNVALTRAKRCLLVVGNFQALKNDEVWRAMLEDAKSRDRFIETNPNDRIAPSLIFSKLFAKQSGNRQRLPKR